MKDITYIEFLILKTCVPVLKWSVLLGINKEGDFLSSS
jgi:hypothetical protein